MRLYEITDVKDMLETIVNHAYADALRRKSNDVSSYIRLTKICKLGLLIYSVILGLLSSGFTYDTVKQIYTSGIYSITPKLIYDLIAHTIGIIASAIILINTSRRYLSGERHFIMLGHLILAFSCLAIHVFDGVISLFLVIILMGLVYLMAIRENTLIDKENDFLKLCSVSENLHISNDAVDRFIDKLVYEDGFITINFMNMSSVPDKDEFIKGLIDDTKLIDDTNKS